MTWKQLTERDRRMWKLSLSTLMIETPGDLEGGPLLWILPLYLHANQKSDDDDEFAYRGANPSINPITLRTAKTL